LAVFFGSGLLGSVYSAVLLPDGLSVGASGALMGILGAYASVLAMAWREGGDEERGARRQALLSVCITAVMVAIISLVPFVDWAAHLFGCVGGALLAMAFFGHRQSPPGGSTMDGAAEDDAAWAAAGVPTAAVAAWGAVAGQPVRAPPRKALCCARPACAPPTCAPPACSRRRAAGAALYAVVLVAGALTLGLRTAPNRSALANSS
jgi:hypothetical protein